MKDTVKFIAHFSCIDTQNELCYFSKRTMRNRSVYQILDDFESLTLPTVSARLPSCSSVLRAKLALYDVTKPNKDGSPNYSFVINYSHE